ncbi:MAG TPA: alpha/beta hydrolase [Chitinophagaceae bacterium]|nr:alpha/beta hydrolase [Chitinophagaceae bacterium]
MKTHFLKYKNSTISYRRYGEGKKLLFCFHGYGESAVSFTFLETILGKTFEIIAIDFPFHGLTEWKDELLFTGADLINIINLISSPGQIFSILGYSMGGRIALHLLQTNPERIEQLVLVAPDGFHHNIWHRFSTKTFIGNKLFAFTMKHPFWLFTLMKLFYKLNLFNKSVFNFVHHYLDEKDSRWMLYKRWTTMRKFNPDLQLLKKIILKNKIPIGLLFGKYDRVILTKHGLAFLKNMEEFVQVKELKAGHQLLKIKYATEIAGLFRR